MVNLPLPSTDAGHQPQVLDQWRQGYHPDQAGQAALRDEIDKYVIDPHRAVHAPNFYDRALPALPAPTPDGHGGVVIPQAGQVR